MCFIRSDELGFDEEKDDDTHFMEADDTIPNGIQTNLRTYLSTITEANSPYGTEYGGSRKYTYYPPTAASVFNHFPKPELSDQHNSIQGTNKALALISRVPTTSESDSPYYPLGSEASARPTTPRFVIEEVSSANYEPILISGTEGRQLANNFYSLRQL